MGGDRRLRIAFVADTITSPIGGGIIAARRFVDELRSRHEVVVIGADAYGPDRIDLGGFILPVPAMRESQFVMALPDRKALRRAFEGVDVVHLQFPFWLSFVALSEARKAGRPVVAAFHVQPENALLNIGISSPWLSRTLYHRWVNRLFDRADAVVCPTRFAERKLRAHGLRAPTFVVSNGVPPDMVPETWPRERAERGDVLLAMVGRLAVEKRHDVLIEAVRRSRHRDRIKLVIAGAGQREEELRRLVRALPNGAEVGFLSRERLHRLLGDADLMVHCSEVELEGIAVLEARSMGLPVLVAEGPETAASELALDDDFRFPVGDVDALGARLDWLLGRPEVLARARERCREAAKGFGIERSVEELVRVYTSVVRERSASGPRALGAAGDRRTAAGLATPGSARTASRSGP